METSGVTTPTSWGVKFFFNHFPARGWKPRGSQSLRIPQLRGILFQSFPRKGMETEWSKIECPWCYLYFFNHFPARGWKHRTLQSPWLLCRNLFQSFPRKGMETGYNVFLHIPTVKMLFQSFPRKGMETVEIGTREVRRGDSTFSIISPQGDGNQTYAVVRRRSLSTSFSIISPQGDGNVRFEESCYLLR